MSDPNRPPEDQPLIRTIAMPADTNPNGDIFGGWLMAQMDLAGGNAAMRRARGRCVTMAVDGMIFHQPVFVGDEVSLYGVILRIGHTSLTIRVEAWRRSRTDEAEQKVTEGRLRSSPSMKIANHGRCPHRLERRNARRS